MSKELRAFTLKYDDKFGQSLSDFFNDPVRSVHSGYGYGGGPDNHLESVQGRCSATLGRLIAKLVEKNVLTVEEALEIADVEYYQGSTFEIREVDD